MVLNVIKLVSVMRLSTGSQTFVLPHFGIACITSCGISGKLVYQILTSNYSDYISLISFFLLYDFLFLCIAICPYEVNFSFKLMDSIYIFRLLVQIYWLSFSIAKFNYLDYVILLTNMDMIIDKRTWFVVLCTGFCKLLWVFISFSVNMQTPFTSNISSITSLT